MLHVRDCDAHEPPLGTHGCWYAVAEELWATVCPSRVQSTGGSTTQASYEKLPESVPFVHVRDSEEHGPGYDTDEDWYAVTDEPLVTVLPLKVQFAGGSTEHDEYWYEPESEPLLHERHWDVHDEPYGTVEAAYAVTPEPCATLPPHGSEQLAGGLT